MNINISIPIKAEIVFHGMKIKVADQGESWERSQLKSYMDKSGVYIHHSNGEIIYIGKTTQGPYGTFGERLRREFHYSASQNSNLYNLLKKNKETVQTIMYDLDHIDMMIDSGSTSLSKERKALIMEQV